MSDKDTKHTALKEKYIQARKELAKEQGAKNLMSMPTLSKIVVNAGTGDKLRDKNLREKMVADFATITGQKPKVQPAKMSVAGFSVRQGMPIGLTSTLRRDRMYNFLDKLISITLPRMRDFRGVPTKSFDKSGNYTLGVPEHIVFPEIDLAKVERPFGLEITLVFENSNADKSKRLLELMGMPFVKEE